jgi:transposase
VLYEFAIVLPEGHVACSRHCLDALTEAKGRLPTMLTDSLDEQVRRIHQLQADIGTIERRLSHQMREISDCKAVAESLALIFSRLRPSSPGWGRQ